MKRLLPCVCFLLALSITHAADAPHIAFITGDDEYRSEYSMPMIAKILEAKHGMRTSIAYARPTPRSNKNIEGLEALKPISRSFSCVGASCPTASSR